LSPQDTPPPLIEVQPRRTLADESVIYPRVLFEPLPYQGAIVDLQVVGDQVDKALWDSPLYLLQ
jgi:hypothetical protein